MRSYKSSLNSQSTSNTLFAMHSTATRSLYNSRSMADLPTLKFDNSMSNYYDMLNEAFDCHTDLKPSFNLVNSLTSRPTNTKKKLIIPFRESTLTKVLKSGLDGNSICIMMANVSPMESHIDENISTLAFANRARKITTNLTGKDKNMNNDELNNIIAELKRELDNKNKLIKEKDTFIGKLKEENYILKENKVTESIDSLSLDFNHISKASSN